MAKGGPRSTASATIAFGLVTAPVKLYAATESTKEVNFNLLHHKCKQRVKQQYVCESCSGQIVPRDAMVKGYEHAPGEFVVFAPEEIKALEEQASGAIEIVEFVPGGAVDPIYYDKASYVAADKGGAKALALIVEAMKRTHRDAVGKWAARGKGYIVLLRPILDGLVLHTLRFTDEVRDVIALDGAAIDEATAKLACTLVEQIASPVFDPSHYRDEGKGRMLAAIQAKIAGGAVAAPAQAPQSAVVDLMAALKASLKAA